MCVCVERLNSLKGCGIINVCISAGGEDLAAEVHVH